VPTEWPTPMPMLIAPSVAAMPLCSLQMLETSIKHRSAVPAAHLVAEFSLLGIPIYISGVPKGDHTLC
jgi:hypothetical protein